MSLKQTEIVVDGTMEQTSFALRCPKCRVLRNFVLVGKTIFGSDMLNRYVCPDPNCTGHIEIKPGGRK